MSSDPYSRLVDAAVRARTSAYCPYSRFAVGAAVLADSGAVYTGANVENGSLSLGLCAERVAIFNAISHGERKLKAVCVACDQPRPCGACRQVIAEFSSKHTVIVLVDTRNGSHRSVKTRLQRLLPDAFDPRRAGLLKR